MTINCKGSLISLSTPKIMGILNITPDSFYDGGKFKNEKDVLKQTETMLNDGATFIDVGAYSSRPNADHISEDVELKRILPIIKLLSDNYPEVLISVDTFRSKVAKQCIEIGAALINDISAGRLDENMMKTVAELHVPYIMMHLKGTPKTMQDETVYDHLINDIRFYFSEQIEKANAYGIKDIIIDPGFGFAKTTVQNYTLLNNLDHLNILDKPILVGVSRKSMVYKPLKTKTEKALNGTTVLNTIALQKGASILRVHDVKEAVEAVTLTLQLNNE